LDCPIVPLMPVIERLDKLEKQLAALVGIWSRMM
jgi:hypothetical protein